MKILLTVVAVAGLACIIGWLAAVVRRQSFRSPERAWETLVELWREGQAAVLWRCLTPESRRLIQFVLDADAPEVDMPRELRDYLLQRGGENRDVYTKEWGELLRLVRTNINKFWLQVQPLPGVTVDPSRRSTELGLLEHILAGVSREADRPAPRVRRILETVTIGEYEYARVLHDPMFAGFGLLDTFKRSGSFWKLDLAAPLMEAAHASKTQFTPGRVMKVTDQMMGGEPGR